MATKPALQQRLYMMARDYGALIYGLWVFLLWVD